MKLAIVRQKYNAFGGAERFVERALAVLREKGVDVSIIAREWDETGKGLRCNPFYLGRTWRDWSFARSVRSIIASARFDLVQSHERIPGCHIYRAGDGVHATWLALRGRQSDVLVPWHRYTLAVEKATILHPALRAVICNSRMVRDDIATRFSVAPHKLHVIYNGVDLDRFAPRFRDALASSQRAKVGTSAATRVVLFVGSGYARKGLPALLAAMTAFKGELWVVGRDKEQARLQRHAEVLGLGKRVRFFGPQGDVLPFYAAANIFALPTLYDPFPNAVLEALACGLPVVTTTTCGAAEILDDECGRVIHAHDHGALAVALEDLAVGDRTEAARAAVEHLGLDAMAGRLLGLYATLSNV